MRALWVVFLGWMLLLLICGGNIAQAQFDQLEDIRDQVLAELREAFNESVTTIERTIDHVEENIRELVGRIDNTKDMVLEKVQDNVQAFEDRVQEKVEEIKEEVRWFVKLFIAVIAGSFGLVFIASFLYEYVKFACRRCCFGKKKEGGGCCGRKSHQKAKVEPKSSSGKDTWDDEPEETTPMFETESPKVRSWETEGLTRRRF